MNHQQIPILQLDGSNLEPHPVPVITEEEDGVSFVLQPLVREAAVFNDVGRALMADPVLMRGLGETEGDGRIPYIVSYTIRNVNPGHREATCAPAIGALVSPVGCRESRGTIRLPAASIHACDHQAAPSPAPRRDRRQLLNGHTRRETRSRARDRARGRFGEGGIPASARVTRRSGQRAETAALGIVRLLRRRSGRLLHPCHVALMDAVTRH